MHAPSTSTLPVSLHADSPLTGGTDASTAARLFHGLGDPTRLSIVLALLAGERRVSDIVSAVGTSQSNVSNHLACLKGCGLVVDRPGERRQVFYSLAHPEVRELLLAAQGLLAATGHGIQLCDHPEMQPPPPTLTRRPIRHDGA